MGDDNNMIEENIRFISTDTLSVDFFKGERRIAIFTDKDYSELKFINGEFGSKVFYPDQPITNTNASLIVGFGDEEALSRAKEIAYSEDTDLILIPTIPTISAFLPYHVDKNLKIKHPSKLHTLLIVKEIINNQPREKLAFGLGALSCMLINLADEATEGFLSGNEINSQKLLEKIKNTFKNIDKFAYPYPTLGFDLAEILYELSSSIKSDCCNPLIAAYLFSLYKNNKESYNNFILAISFAIFAVYNGYQPEKELILPPNRSEVYVRLKELLPSIKPTPSLFSEDFLLARFVLSDRYEEIISALSDFPKLAQCYLRLNGNSGYYLRSLLAINELIEILPLAAEIDSHNTILKHVYSSGYFK